MSLPLDGSGRLVSHQYAARVCRLAMDVKSLAGLCFDPFTVDVGDILFEKRWVVELKILIKG